MPEEYQNIYKIARRAAGFTQEAAAERLGVSVESVRAYETGQRIPSNEIVDRMVICYNAIPLAYQHLKETNVLLSKFLPRLEPPSTLAAAVQIYLHMSRFVEKHSIERLLEIAQDNVIDEDERPEYDQIMADLREIVRSSLELDVYIGQPPRDVN